VAQVVCPRVVGREAEREVLAAQLEAAQAGAGGTVVLLGEAGIGKSRLARDLLSRAADAGLRIAVGRGTPAGGAGAYKPLAEALLQALRRHPVLDHPALAAWLPALAGILPLGDVAGTSSEASVAVRGEALVRLLGRLADPPGFVLVLEDLHWADPDTLSLAEYLADNGSGERLLVVLTVRTGEPSRALDLARRLRGRPGVVQLELSRLDDRAVVEMVRACWGDVPDAVLERVEGSADGVPLLVEELLASPGVPTSFAESVRERLLRFDADGRNVLEAAAVLGRQFDWELLGPVTGLAGEVVASALAEAVERLLLQVEGQVFRFRHALTRDAVLAGILPPRQVAVARAALSALRDVHPDLEGPWRELAADLASRAGDRAETGTLLTAIGEDALARGALATAIETLQRAVEIAPDRMDTVLLLVEALALAGRVDDAVEVTRAVRGGTPAERSQLHLRLAQAAVAAGRWPMADDHVRAARRATEGAGGGRALAPALAVLEAEVALAADDVAASGEHAGAALEAGTDPALRCHALEVLGRIARLTDPNAARERFEQALTEADAAGLAVWRVRALHEIGTIDMLERAAPERLEEAREGALRIGALGTAAVVGLQLAATSICRWEPAAAMDHCRSSLELAEALRIGDVREKALLFMAEASALRGDADAVDGYLAASGALERPGRPAEGFCWGFRGELALVRGDLDGARRGLDTGTGILAAHPHAEPAAFRALWTLLLAAAGEPRAGDAVEAARRAGVDVFNLNRGLIGYAEAVLAGAADAGRAATLAAEADRGFVNAATWRALARILASGAARAHGWGDPTGWLQQGAVVFAALDLPGLAGLCRDRLAAAEPDPWAGAGLTPREREVLQLVVRGLPNKEIAQRLAVSARTVEKHVEALLRKTEARSRTQLAVWAADPSGQTASRSR
jgi:DNA-binding CsgD family transcriptional regulator/tetratricopeptide (TPR) repeat protein